ncbi:MAG: rfaE bifunctional protein, partial [Planctomycetaceae bacterium]|nr:rfaE bifunctional protein [Planctomycetaceae bacterium]
GVSGADAVVAFDQLDPERLLELIQPDVYVLGDDYCERSIPGAGNCGRIEFVERLAGFSTTAAVERLKGNLLPKSP